MSGECDKCGEHCLDCNCRLSDDIVLQKTEKDIFYFQGKYFETFEELVAYNIEWRKMPLDQETAERQLDTFKRDLIMNIFLRGISLNNLQFENYLTELFRSAILLMPTPE